jgi:hypothetical protein
MSSTKYMGMDVHKESISIAVMNSIGKFVMESVIETKASTILQFIDGLRGDLRVTFEEGTWAAWLYAVGAFRVPVTKCTPQGTVRNGSARSAKPASDGAPNTTTNSWMFCASCGRKCGGTF